MEMPSAFRYCEDEEDQTDDQTGLPQTSRLEKDLRERGILSDALRRLVVASVEEMVVPNRALALTERILAALRSLLSEDMTSRTSSKINDCLWKFVTCQELLRRHSSLSAQSTAVISTSRSCYEHRQNWTRLSLQYRGKKPLDKSNLEDSWGLMRIGEIEFITRQARGQPSQMGSCL